jgi:hypothetical protein
MLTVLRTSYLTGKSCGNYQIYVEVSLLSLKIIINFIIISENPFSQFDYTILNTVSKHSDFLIFGIFPDKRIRFAMLVI